jgi:succinylglutamate desuccinylase
METHAVVYKHQQQHLQSLLAWPQPVGLAASLLQAVLQAASTATAHAVYGHLCCLLLLSEAAKLQPDAVITICPAVANCSSQTCSAVTTANIPTTCAP